MNSVNFKNVAFIIIFVLILSVAYLYVTYSGNFDTSIYMDIP